MSGLVEQNIVIQIALVVRDLEAASKKWADFLGAPVPPVTDAGPYEVSEAIYMGEPMLKGNITQAVFQVGENLQLELMQPNGHPSEWQSYLDMHGEGVHHIAFETADMEKRLELCEAAGYKCTQKGEFASRMGRYAYIDTLKTLKTTIEFLEFDNGPSGTAMK